MNPLKIITLLIALMLIPMFALAATGKHALLIGIQYDKNTLLFLEGPANDVELTKRMLRGRFGFEDEDFMILKNEQATHTGIENAYHELIKKVKPGDFVYLYYSGHGSQTADLNGDETDNDGMDETWVSYRSRFSTDEYKDNYDVLDDEIGAWLAQLYAKTDKVVFVSDSCHSATVSRASQAVVRAVKEDERPHLLGNKSYQKPKKHRGIRVGAAGDHESAINTKMADGKSYGVFTWYWVQNLHNARVNDTWHHVFLRTYEQVTAKLGMVQQPYMEGDLSQQVLGINPKPQTIPVTVIAPNEWIRIEAGQLEGVTEGSIYRQYQSKHSDSQNLPRLTIHQVEAFESFGEPKGTGKNPFQTGDQAIEERHAYHTEPTLLYLEADFPDTEEDKLLLKAIKDAFQQQTYGRPRFPNYQLTDNPNDAQWRLYLLRPKRKNGQFIYEKDDALPKYFSNQSPELWVLTPDGHLLNQKLRIAFDNTHRGIELLANHLNRLARIRELKRLKNPRREALPITVQASTLSPVTYCPADAKCVQLSDYDLGWYRQTNPNPLQKIAGSSLNKDEILDFTLHNHSQQDYYCYLISIGSDNNIWVIFPDPRQPSSALITKNETRPLRNEVILPLTQTGDATIQVITSKQPINVLLLEQTEFKRDGLLNPLEQLLFNLMHDSRQRSTLLEYDEWATEHITFKVN
jgi:hypothetical protein